MTLQQSRAISRLKNRDPRRRPNTSKDVVAIRSRKKRKYMTQLAKAWDI